MFLEMLFGEIAEIVGFAGDLVGPALLAFGLAWATEFGWEKTFAELIERAIPGLKPWQPAFIILVGFGLAYGLGLDFTGLLVDVDLSGDLGEVLTGLILAALAMWRHEKSKAASF